MFEIMIASVISLFMLCLYINYTIIALLSMLGSPIFKRTGYGVLHLHLKVIYYNLLLDLLDFPRSFPRDTSAPKPHRHVESLG